MATGLRQRGYEVHTLQELQITSTPDPEVIRALAEKFSRPWVLVTQDGAVIEDHPKFEWQRYAIAWVQLPPHRRGEAAEYAKAEIVQRHAHRMVDQRPPDHFTYTVQQRHRDPPSLVS